MPFLIFFTTLILFRMRLTATPYGSINIIGGVERTAWLYRQHRLRISNPASSGNKGCAITTIAPLGHHLKGTDTPKVGDKDL